MLIKIVSRFALLCLRHVQLDVDGSVKVSHSGTEMGQGIDTRMAQVAATSLGVPLQQVEILPTENTLISNTPPTTMSSTDLCGEAIVRCAAKLIFLET